MDISGFEPETFHILVSHKLGCEAKIIPLDHTPSRLHMNFLDLFNTISFSLSPIRSIFMNLDVVSFNSLAHIYAEFFFVLYSDVV